MLLTRHQITAQRGARIQGQIGPQDRIYVIRARSLAAAREHA